jgi:hypothetical protein
MKNFNIIIFLITFVFFSSCKKEELIDKTPSNEIRTCATHENFIKELESNPGLKQKMDEAEIALQSNIGSRSTNSGTVTIPVVVHLLYNTPAQNISDAQILSQIDILNKDFSRTNIDASSTPQAFQSVAGNPDIQFCMARRTPTGAPTNGIVRKYTTVASWSANGAMKLSNLGGDDAWDCNQYLNIWVCNLGGSLGYANYPGGNPIADGVVIRYSVFGNSNIYWQYNLGRTATHEIGHWLHLYHIWGDLFCGDDFMYDTPTQQAPNFNCPAFPHVTCSNAPNGDMYCNYMDYTYDACLNMFTIGQCNKMRACLQIERTPILTSQGCNPPSVCSTPSGLYAANISSTTTTINWTSTGATMYYLGYKNNNNSQPWITLSSNTNSKTITGLSPNTTYTVQVWAICNTPAGKSGASTLLNFTTL